MKQALLFSGWRVGTEIVIVRKDFKDCYNILLPNGAGNHGSKATGRVNETQSQEKKKQINREQT